MLISTYDYAPFMVSMMVVRDAFHTGTMADNRLMNRQNSSISTNSHGLKKADAGRLKLSEAFTVIRSASNLF